MTFPDLSMSNPRQINKAYHEVNTRYNLELTDRHNEPASNSLYHGSNTRYQSDKLPDNLQPESRLKIEQQARSVACLVEKELLIETEDTGSTQYSISADVPTLADKLQMRFVEWFKQYCEKTNMPYSKEESPRYDDDFGDELSLGHGTAFLIGKQIALTPAHCVYDTDKGNLFPREKLRSIWLLFGFQMQSSNQIRTTFEHKDVYRIEAVWNYEFKSIKVRDGSGILVDKVLVDWAIVKLDREVEERDPLSLAFSPAVALNTQLYMLGYPTGIPLKLTMSGKVQKKENHIFDADLDAFAGNSGSPIFTLETGGMIGMLLSGAKDYDLYPSPQNPNKKVIRAYQVPRSEIREYGYEKCHEIASIDFLKTVLSSSFKMVHSHFSGRIQYLKKLQHHLTPSPSTKVHLLYGLGGMGKSELANAFANQNLEAFSFIWSISYGSEKELRVGYQGLAQKLQVPLDEKETLVALIRKVYRKLEQNESKPWLLLLDNLQQPLILPTKGGSVIITSRSKLDFPLVPKEAVIATEVLPLEPPEALELLTKVTQKSGPDCQKLLDQIGCYPLVLGQVAGYIAHTGIEVDEYLANFEQYQHLSTLEAALNMTLQKLSPYAKEWLFLCSYLNQSLIPFSYLNTWLKEKSQLEEKLKIIDALEEHALLRVNEEEEIFSLHVELQKILRSIAPPDTESKAAHLLADMRKEWDFENTSNWVETVKKATVWASHTEPLVAKIENVSLNNLEKTILLEGLGDWKEKVGHFKEALEYHLRILEIRKATFGDKHSDVAKSLNNIGNCYHSQGNESEAIKIHDQALKIRREVLGDKHPDVARSLNNIGTCYHSQRKDIDAIKMYSEALGIYQVAFGDIHPQVAMCLSNIGVSYNSQEQYEEALRIQRQALEIWRETLGDKHPLVANSLCNIGNTYALLEQYDTAFEMQSQAMEIYRDTLGDKHPDVAPCLVNIGVCFLRKKNYSEAIRFLQQGLEILREILGDKHLDVAIILCNTGSCYFLQRNYTEALNMFGQAHEIKREALGDKHPDVAHCLDTIGHCYNAQKNYKKALDIYSQALQIRLEVLEENHPEISKNLSYINLCHVGLKEQEAYYKAEVQRLDGILPMMFKEKKNFSKSKRKCIVS